MEKKYPQVRVFHNEEPGTLLARKRGILEATGYYITFSDQDDWYMSTDSLSKMVQAIEEDGSQICQFGFYKSYFKPLFFRKITGRKAWMTRETLFQDDIVGIIGTPNKAFNVNVWSKIYDAEVLKAAVQDINVSLCFAEDMYLNLHAFFQKDTLVVSSREEAYYVWNVGIGFSSVSEHALLLFNEYQYIKPVVLKLAAENGCTGEMAWLCHLETIYFFKTLIVEKIRSGSSTDECLQLIGKLNAYEYVDAAKNYFRNQPNEKVWDELRFLSSDCTPEKYLEFCRTHMPPVTAKQRLLKLIHCVKRRK